MFKTLAHLLITTILLQRGYCESAESSAEEIYQIAYVKINNADRLFTQKKKPEARSNYTEALGFIELLAQKYPQWEPSIIKYRKIYINERLKELGSIQHAEIDGLVKDANSYLSEKETNNTKGLKRIVSIEPCAKYTYPFNENEIIQLSGLSVGGLYDPEKEPYIVAKILESKKYIDCKIKTYEARAETGEKGVGIVIIVEQNVSLEEVEKYNKDNKWWESSSPNVYRPVGGNSQSAEQNTVYPIPLDK